MDQNSDLHCYSTFSSDKEEKWNKYEKKKNNKSQTPGRLQIKF